MAQYLLKLPKMGESVAEATVTKWLKEIGDNYCLWTMPIVEIATDKVDTDVSAEVSGILLEKRFEENAVVAVGDVLAVIETEGQSLEHSSNSLRGITQRKVDEILENEKEESVPIPEVSTEVLLDEIKIAQETVQITTKESSKFYSPLVRNIAQEEGIPLEILQTIVGTGKDQRVTKKDILDIY